MKRSAMLLKGKVEVVNLQRRLPHATPLAFFSDDSRKDVHPFATTIFRDLLSLAPCCSTMPFLIEVQFNSNNIASFVFVQSKLVNDLLIWLQFKLTNRRLVTRSYLQFDLKIALPRCRERSY
jgi:hypothetical protein